MLTVKTRKVGNSISLPIPKEFHIEVGREYVAYKSSGGGLIFSPKISNPFASGVPYEDSPNEEWQEQAIVEMKNV